MDKDFLSWYLSGLCTEVNVSTAFRREKKEQQSARMNIMSGQIHTTTGRKTRNEKLMIMNET
jgi:hypothetical protein